MATRRLHFVLVPFPAQGHISPILRLSKLLAQKGATVTVANIEPVHRQLQQRCPSTGLDVRLVGIPFPLDAPLGIEGSWYSRLPEFMTAVSEMRWPFEDVIRDLISGDTSAKFVLIADYVVGWHTEIADKFDIAAATYWPGNAYWFALHYHLPDVQSKKDVPVRDPEKVVDYIPGVPPVKLKDFPVYVQPGSVEYGAVFTRIPLEEKWVLVNSTYELQPETFQVLQELLGKKVIPIGPLFTQSSSTSSSSLRNEEDCTCWLGAQALRSVLYISFGSIATLTDSEFQTLVEGLEVSRVPFLWVVRSELIPTKSVEFYQDFIKRIESTQRGLVVGWAPQLEVLSHEAVGGFLSHCGWNSIFESISAGVPILGCPCISEQRLNCKLVVEDWKVGTRLSSDDDNVAEVIIEFMSKSSLLRERVMELKKLMDAATSPEGSSTNNLAYFFKEMANL